ncbi:MAG: arginine--tRNA ligase, partial [Candidatus Brennerbacteria bacterium]|nr:arginine--tRNA ligase [Candidatus Brennerbacteria bacterium]
MREKIITYLKTIVPKSAVINLTVPENDKFGHYSTNVAFTSGLSAEEIARKVRNKAPAGFFKKIEAAGGFVNFWISDGVLQKEIGEILKRKKPAVAGAKAGKGKIQIEFVSANPTGPLTLANGRGGFLGDVLSNVLEAMGNEVEREYYVNDTGNQIVTLGKSMTVALGLNLGQPADEKNLYKGEYVKKWAGSHKPLVKKYEKNLLKLGQFAAKDFLKDIKSALKKSDISFDRWTSEERDIRKKSFTDKALKTFMAKKLVYKKDGATWLKTTAFGDDKDRVLVTSDGFPTYFLADAGHYLETKSRGFGKKINILGPDHFGYVRRIQAAAQIVGLKNSEIIVTQAVRLMEGGKEVKMSKRKGEFVMFQDLMSEVGVDAARFFFLMVSPDTHMDFDLALAKERSVKNPVYYVQYAYVRAINIIKRAPTT